MSTLNLLHLPTGALHTIVSEIDGLPKIDKNTIIGVITYFIKEYVSSEFDEDMDDIQLTHTENACMTTYNITQSDYERIIDGIIDYTRYKVIANFYHDANNLPEDIWTKIDMDEFDFVESDIV